MLSPPAAYIMLIPSNIIGKCYEADVKRKAKRKVYHEILSFQMHSHKHSETVALSIILPAQ